MKARKRSPEVPVSRKRLVDVDELCSYLSLGKNTAVQFAKSVGAEVNVGRCKRYDIPTVDAALDKQAQEA